VRKAYHPCSAETSRKSGDLIYPEPLGPPRPVAGDLYLYIYSTNIPPIMIINRIYEYQNLLYLLTVHTVIILDK